MITHFVVNKTPIGGLFQNLQTLSWNIERPLGLPTLNSKTTGYCKEKKKNWEGEVLFFQLGNYNSHLWVEAIVGTVRMKALALEK
jgi:hypothetical protein